MCVWFVGCVTRRHAGRGEATGLLAAGIELYAAARILRHTDPKLTAKTCAHNVRQVELEPTPGLEPGTYGLRSGTGSRRARGVPILPFSHGYGFGDFPERPHATRQSQPVCCISAARIATTRFAKDAVERLGIKRSTVYTLCAKGELNCATGSHSRRGSVVNSSERAGNFPRPRR